VGRPLARTLVGLATTIAAAKMMTAYAQGCYVNRLVERPLGRIKG